MRQAWHPNAEAEVALLKARFAGSWPEEGSQEQGWLEGMCWVFSGGGRNASWHGCGEIRVRVLMPTPSSALLAPAELRVKLTSVQGERTMWSAMGHQSRAWMNQTLLVTSLVEFQVWP